MNEECNDDDGGATEGDGGGEASVAAREEDGHKALAEVYTTGTKGDELN